MRLPQGSVGVFASLGILVLAGCGGGSSGGGQAALALSCATSNGQPACSTVIQGTSSTLKAGKLKVQLTNKLSSPVTVIYKEGSTVEATQQIAAGATKTETVNLTAKGDYTVTTEAGGQSIFNPGGGFTIG